MSRRRLKKSGYVYLLIDTSRPNKGFYFAKYGYTRSCLKARIRYAKRGYKEAGLDVDFNFILAVKVKKPSKKESEIKFNLRCPDFCQLAAFSEFFSIPKEHLDAIVNNFFKICDSDDFHELCKLEGVNLCLKAG